MVCTVLVEVDWPEGVDFDPEECKSIASGVLPQRWQRDVSMCGGNHRGIVWASARSECSVDDVHIVEDVEL